MPAAGTVLGLPPLVVCALCVVPYPAAEGDELLKHEIMSVATKRDTNMQVLTGQRCHSPQGLSA